MEENILSAVKVGETVKDFAFDVYLPDKKDFSRMKFSDVFKEKKWLILVFYPADFTFVCPTELADIGEKNDIFAKEGAEVVSMSTDTHFVHYAWHNQEKLLACVKYAMGADPNHKISKAFGVYDDETGLSLRGTFIIDPDGKLVSSEVNYYNVGRSSEELMRKFMAFKYVREHPFAVCPAKWEPGEKTLDAGDKSGIGNVSEKLNGK